jgi:uncharacterized iron-regulated membrane protein
MKLSVHAFVRFWDVHAWAGVIGGLVLYVMFLTGSITLFHQELALWSEPLSQRPAVEPSPGLEQAFDAVVASVKPGGDSVWFYPPLPGRAAAKLAYEERATGAWTSAWIDASRGEVVPERERLSEFLYSLHFLWHDATGDWLYRLSGFLSVALLLAIVSGVLIHLKDLVRQFHQFRPQRSPRVVFSDLHKVLGVMGLPFQLLYAYTGAVIVLAPLVLPAFVGPVFRGDTHRAGHAVLGYASESAVKLGGLRPSLPLEELVRRARLAIPLREVESIKVSHYGRDGGSVEVRGAVAETPEGEARVRLRAADGAVERVKTDDADGGGRLRRWIYGLHFVHFGGVTARSLFFVLGIGACVTILSGNWIWLARREEKRSSTGNRILSRLTAGVGAGSLVAVAGLFLASRCLPLDIAGRGTIEELVFLGLLSGFVVWALAVRDERGLYRKGMGIAGAMLVPVPLLAARWSPAGLFGSGPRIPEVLGVDLALLAAGSGLGAAALTGFGGRHG